MKSNKGLYYALGVIVALGILVVVAFQFGWIGKQEETAVAVEKVGRHNITETVPTTGKIFPQTEVKISAEVSGEIINLLVKEGDSVQAGQLLVKINPNIYQTALSRAEAYLNQMKSTASSSRANLSQMKVQFDQASKAYNRNKELIAQKVISDQEFEQIESTFKSAQANVEAAFQNVEAADFNVKSAEASLQEAKENLAKTVLYSPISGIVSKVNIEQGERVVGTAQMSGTELMRIADLNHVEARVDINENDILRVGIGDSADIEIDAFKDRKFKGQVTDIAYSSKNDMQITSDQVTNFTVKVRIFPESYADLIQSEKGHRFPFRPGMSSSVDIRTKTVTDVIAVPIPSVTTRTENEKDKSGKSEKGDEKRVVFVVDNGKVKSVPVVMGIQDQNYVQITEGLKGGESVVIAPFKTISKTLKDDMKVVIKSEEDLYKKKAEN